MILKPVLLATAVAGTLDLLSAFVFAGMAGTAPLEVLEFVASGPFGDQALHRPGYEVLGVLVHYLIMLCMVSAYMVACQHLPWLLQRAVTFGTLYGLLLWFVMYWIVRPLRWENLPHPNQPLPIAKQLVSHVLLVGIPIALIAARYLRPQWRGSKG